jgi:hypothetical protein
MFVVFSMHCENAKAVGCAEVRSASLAEDALHCVQHILRIDIKGMQACLGF